MPSRSWKHLGLLLGTSSIAVLSMVGTAAAQDSSAQSGSQPHIEEVLVTGSHIPQPDLTSTSPLTVVGSQEIKLEGTTRTEDLLNNLPQVFAGQGDNVSNAATGTATVNLRDLGPSRTLVLIDGKRLLPGDPRTPVPDLNFIPASLIDHVEVLTGGASAAYGSDAVAGVVNFLMKQDFEGVRVDAQGSFYQHDNSDQTIQGLERGRGFIAPNDTKIDGWSEDVSLVLGINSDDHKGNITLYGSYRKIAPVTEDQRDYSACALTEVHTGGFACAGSGTTDPSRFIVGSNDLIIDSTTGNTLRPYNGATDAYNYAPYNYYQRNDLRYTAGAYGHYELNPKVTLYTSVMFMDDHTDSLIAPSGLFGQSFSVPCSNPLLSADEVNTFCTSRGLTAADSATVNILRRNVEGGGRRDDIRHTDYRLVVGARGSLDDAWSYDISAQNGQVTLNDISLNDMSLTRIQNALNVTTNPTTGQPACTTDVANGCLPYNIFSTTPVSKNVLSYLEVPASESGNTNEQVVTGTLSGELGSYGVTSPFAHDGVGVAIGAEYRRESLNLTTDLERQSGDLAGSGGAVKGNSGSYDVYEFFGEIRAPLVQNMPFVEDLSVDGGYRFSQYNTAGSTNTYKGELDYSPTADIRFRTSYNRAVRAPNVVELFTPQALGNDGTNDPCWGTSPTATLAQCERTGATPAQYGHIVSNSANQITGLAGGNPDLKPEKSRTLTFGAVLTPQFLDGFTATVDYFNIGLSDEVGKIGADLILNQCANTGATFYCALIHRDPTSGTLWLGNAGYVTDTNINAGEVKTSGVDFQADYSVDLDKVGIADIHNAGAVEFSFIGTYLDKFVTTPVPGGGSYNCAGLYGVTCGVPSPSWRHKLRVTWDTPWQAQISLAWRYIGSVAVDKSSTNTLLAGAVYPADAKIGAVSYLDLTANWQVHEDYVLRFGINNLLDVDPPLVGATAAGVSGFTNGNTYPQVYDALGRYVFFGITADL